MDWTISTIETSIRNIFNKENSFLDKFNDGYSFENWTTKKISESIRDSSNIIPILEVGYEGLTEKYDDDSFNKQSADLLLINHNDREISIIEAAMVLPMTQSKWKAKIAYDYEKLEAIDHRNTNKFLIVYSCSTEQKTLGPDGWDYWFDEITLSDGRALNRPHHSFSFPFGKNGEWSIRIWSIQ